ncbi:MAG: zinc metalloprotease HtpX [Bacillota bacterium]
MHRMKTFILMVLMTVLLIVLGQAIAGQQGLIFAFVIALGMNFISYWYSDKISIKMTKSRPLSEDEAPEVYEIVRRLSNRAKIPMPDIYLTPSEQPNAFATGRNPNNAAIAVTQGIRKLLSKEELEGVIAHEMAHIKNRDTLISTIVAVMAGVLTFLSRIGRFRMIFGGRSRNNEGGAAAILRIVAIILAPIAAILIKLAVSRSREYVADETGARISGDPKKLASALQKMQNQVKAKPMEVNEATSHMFILNPLSGEGLTKLFSTHPPLEERIEKLNKMRV